MAKVNLKQLKEMIREAVREQLEEQISGLPLAGGGARRPKVAGGRPAPKGGNPWLQGNFSLEQLVAAMKDEADPEQKKLIKQAVMTKLKAAGW